jgi:hypothetical protein
MRQSRGGHFFPISLRESVAQKNRITRPRKDKFNARFRSPCPTSLFIREEKESAFFYLECLATNSNVLAQTMMKLLLLYVVCCDFFSLFRVLLM